MYILITDLTSDSPQIVRDSAGLLQWFTTEEEAHQYAVEHEIKDYELFKVSDE